MSKLLLACVVGFLLGMSRPAHATNYLVQFCPQVDTDYDDAIPGAGDHWVADSNRQARGFWVRVVEDTGVIPLPVVWEDYTEDGPTDVGCTPALTLDSTRDYDVVVRSEAQIGTNLIFSMDNDTDQNLESTKVLDDYSPTQNEAVVGTPLNGATSPRWNHLAAAAYALWQHDGGLTNEEFDLYTDTSASGAYVTSESGGSHLGAVKRKYVVTHEIGHLVAGKVDVGGLGCAHSYAADTDGCQGDEKPSDDTASPRGHTQLQKEYQSGAGCEGMGDFYAALVWNDDGHLDDCDFVRHYGLDWNDDGTNDINNVTVHSCYGDPFSGSPDPVDDLDWLEDLVAADDDDVDVVQCDGTLTNRGTQYDWLRYFWGLRTRQDALVDEADIWALWDAADPYDWGTTDAGLHGTCGTTEWPAERIECAADTSTNPDMDLAHDNEKDNGLDH
jgi:hypothetical protein